MPYPAAFPSAIDWRLEQFTGGHVGASDQHKDMRQSAQARDNANRRVFLGWLQTQPPFAAYQPDQLVSLSTRVVADASVNCDNVVEIGQKSASEMSGKKFTNITLRGSDKVKAI